MNIQPSQLRSFNGEAEKLSYDRYEAVLELYQAENAVQIARSLGRRSVLRRSPSVKLRRCWRKREDMNARKMDTHAIVSAAREAAQMAEDARTIAVKRRDEERTPRVRSSDRRMTANFAGRRSRMPHRRGPKQMPKRSKPPTRAVKLARKWPKPEQHNRPRSRRRLPLRRYNGRLS